MLWGSLLPEGKIERMMLIALTIQLAGICPGGSHQRPGPGAGDSDHGPGAAGADAQRRVSCTSGGGKSEQLSRRLLEKCRFSEQGRRPE